MAQTGFTPILIYGSGTATNVPSASNLTNSANGSELALNYADGKLFYKDSGGVVQTIASKAATSGTFSSVTITGGTINGTSVGATTASTGAFTTLSASSTVSGTGFSTYLASPPASGGTAAAAIPGTTITANIGFVGAHNGSVGATTPSTGAFTTLSATGAITSTLATGTAPFTVASTTPVANLSIGGNAATATSATTATTATSATTATTATNVAGGAANQLPYQTGAGATSFITAPTVASTSLTWNGSSFTWAAGGSTVTVTNDTSTASNLYPLFATATSGTVSSVNTSNAKLLYKPSTGDLQASQVVASNGLVVNSKTVAASYSIPSGSNAMSAGPMTVATGQSVTVPSGSRWVIL
jgi:hypothetical protein